VSCAADGGAPAVDGGGLTSDGGGSEPRDGGPIPPRRDAGRGTDAGDDPDTLSGGCGCRAAGGGRAPLLGLLALVIPLLSRRRSSTA